MKEIPVWSSTRRGGRGHHTLVLVAHAQVDDADYPGVSAHTWLLKRSHKGRTTYAYRSANVNGRRVELFLHREIMGLEPLAQDAREVDHRDHCGLNCTRVNLRIVDRRENMMNLATRRGSRSGFKGVSPRPDGKCQALIQRDRQKIYLGLHPDPYTAAFVYNQAARLLFGDFGYLNTIPEDKLPGPERQAELTAQVERIIRSYRVAHTPPATVAATR